MDHFFQLNWSVGHSEGVEQSPADFVPAIVPGAVQLDWARARGWPPFWQGDNCRTYDWMEDKFWHYRAVLALPNAPAGTRPVFVCGGVDYACTVKLNRRTVLEHEGMFTSFELDLAGLGASDGDVLEIVVHPAPKRRPSPPDRVQASASVKPAVSYGWDWHPRLIPLGIWEDTHVEFRPICGISGLEVQYELAADFRTAALRAVADVPPAAVGAIGEWMLTAPDGSSIGVEQFRIGATQVQWEFQLDAPELWWPHDHGGQPLYALGLRLLDAGGRSLDQRSRRFGLRRTRLVMHEGAWDEPVIFPKSRSTSPITLEINGRTIFAKGSNWVCPEVFPGVITAETYRPLLQLAKQTNFNLLRCWGGASVSKDAFFDQCDELGLMVWQEFPLACNEYPDTAEYLRVLDTESRSILRRLRRHPCVVLWCGGNELFNAWSGMTDQALPLRLLNRNCFDLDPGTPFLPTAPVDGMGHGDYRFRDEAGREPFQIFAEAKCTAYTEFGCPGPSPVDYLKTFIPAEDFFPPREGTAWETHHGFKAWKGDTWLTLSVLRHYFGEAPNLDTLVAQGTWLQTEGVRAIFEEARRQKLRCSMALNWCFNEPWPTVANNSLVNWPARPKPALTSVQAACRPVCASARIPKFSWEVGELFTAELWLLNDRPHPLAAGLLRAEIECAGTTLPVLEWMHPAAPAGRNLPGPRLSLMLPEVVAERFVLHVRCPADSGRDATYTLHLRPRVMRKVERLVTPMLNA